MTSNPAPRDAIDAADRALLERLAARVVELRLEVPAILTLETGRPLSFLAAQSLYFFEPLLAGIGVTGATRFGKLLERREAVELLIRSIERQADDTQRARREAAAARRAARRKPRAS